MTDETSPPATEAAREFGLYVINTEDDDAAVVEKLLEWFGKERLSRLIAVAEKRIRAASEAA